jgi:hypothetical protein
MPEQIARTSASSVRGERAASVRRTPCLGAIVQYAVQRSVVMCCILSSRVLAFAGGSLPLVRFPSQA